MPVIIAKHNPCNRYMREFFRIYNIKSGEEFETQDYLRFIREKHLEFKKANNIGAYESYTEEQAQEFYLYLQNIEG